MKPIRTERTERTEEVAHDGWTGAARPLQDQQVEHVVSATGGIESQTTGRRYALQCGCLKPAGGFCEACGSLVCVDCSGHCHRCARPLGGCHSVFVAAPDGTRLRFCQACHDTGKRRATWRRIGRALLAPFVAFEEGSDD